jgi:hypothetical protein
MKLEGKDSSWENFFDVVFNLKNPIERQDGRSISNFWAFVQHLQQQYINRMFDDLEPCEPPSIEEAFQSVKDKAEEAHDIAKTMVQYGGGFVRQLGNMLAHADPKNVAKIKATWPGYWAQYKKMVKK